jgi:hypothetical protein
LTVTFDVPYAAAMTSAATVIVVILPFILHLRFEWTAQASAGAVAAGLRRRCGGAAYRCTRVRGRPLRQPT